MAEGNVGLDVASEGEEVGVIVAGVSTGEDVGSTVG